MDKQQTISIELAKWLGKSYARIAFSHVIYDAGAEDFVFNPFAPTTEGRAQFAECVVKFHVDGYFFPIGGCPTGEEEFKADWLETIYYAIGGTDTWSIT